MPPIWRGAARSLGHAIERCLKYRKAQDWRPDQDAIDPRRSAPSEKREPSKRLLQHVRGILRNEDVTEYLKK
jgi:hypothetical protein